MSIADYEPIDLSEWCNAGLDVLDGDRDAPLGRSHFRGLPFLVGADGDGSGNRCFIALDGTRKGVTIPLGLTAQRVIFAHRLLESALLQGGPLGEVVAEYVIHFADASEMRVPIRERFEIAAIEEPPVPGGKPFLAVTDRKETLLPRYQGQWGEAGLRQTEALAARAQSYHLWSLRNPEPLKAIETVEIVPKGPRFLIAAITLGHLDEHPFARQGRREARIELTRSEDAEAPFDLEVEVDRGAATYVYPLPLVSEEEFLNDSFKGFGETQNPKSSPAYVEVAAIPSATVTVKRGAAEVGNVRWGDVEKGLASTPTMNVKLLDRGRNWVRVTVLDEDTGRPVPCRVHFRSPEGIPYQPHGYHNHVNSNLGTWHVDVGGDVRLGQITYAYIDGTCEGWLPRGEVIVDIARGFEYEPLRAKVNIQPGQRELSLKIKRWIDMNSRGWFSGDSHVHFLSTQGGHAEARGEDLNVVNVLQSQWGSLFTNTEDFTGAPSVSEDGQSIVYVGQENRQHFLGHMILWGLKEPVMPWCSDGLSEAELGGTMETTMSHWADRCHAQGGTVIIPHFPISNGEPATLIATGRVDGVEMIRHQEFNHNEYYRYLNCGYRLPLVGGTDKMSSDVPVGLYRTYAYIQESEEFSYDSWCRSVAAGRTFLSGGPIVHLSVNGYQVGDTVPLPGPGTVEVEMWAESIFPIHTLELVQEGRVVASAHDPKGTRRLELSERVQVDGNSWLAARCGGPTYYESIPHHDDLNRLIFGHTSPVYVACGGEWWMYDNATAKYMLTLVDGGLAYIRDSAALHESGSVTHHHGEADHLAYLQRPFLEAREAIQRRMNRSR